MSEEKSKYSELKTKYPDILVLQLMGNFYIAYGRDAAVLNRLTGYKIKTMKSQKLRCGFPAGSEKALENVKMVCEKNSVSYALFRNSDPVLKKEYDNNQFSNIVSEKEIMEEKQRNTEEKTEPIKNRQQTLRYIQTNGKTLEEAMMCLYLRIKDMNENDSSIKTVSSITTESCKNGNGYEVYAIVVFEEEIAK